MQNGFRQLGFSESLSEANGGNIRLGADYYLSKNHTIGILVNAGSTGGEFLSNDRNIISTDLITNFGDDTPADVIIPISSIDSVLIAGQLGDLDQTRQTYNLNYVYSNGANQLNVDFDYGQFRTTRITSQPNIYFNSTETEILAQRDYLFDTPITIDIYTAKLDYETETFGGKIGAGLKYSLVGTDNLFEFNDIIDDVAAFNDRLSNQFFYNESVYAGYLSYGKSLGQKVSFTSGLRTELTNAESELIAFLPELQEPVRDSSYVSLFPSLGVRYIASPRSTFALNYGRRINRPDYNVLNPFRTQTTELSFSSGNPALNPEIVNNIEIGYTLDYRFNFKLAYSLTTNQITRLIGTDDSDVKASFINWDNLAEQRVLSFNAALPFQLSDKWNAFFNLTANRTDNQATYPDGNVIDLQAWSYNIFQQHTYNLPKGFVFEFSSWFSGPGIWGGVFEYDSSYAINFGLQKRFLGDKLNVKLAVQDVTNQSFWNGFSEFDGLLSFGQGNWDSRRGSISVTYNFGSSEVKASRKRSIGLEAESDRIEN